MNPGKNESLFFDSHAHLEFDEFGDDISHVLQRAHDAGVKGIVTVGAGRGLKSAEEAVELSEKNAGLWAAVGLHPHEASQYSADIRDRLVELAQDPSTVAIGETGLDYYYNHSEPHEQKLAFREQITLSKDLGLPLIVHCRDAYRDTLQLLSGKGLEKNSGIIHCFSGDAQFAQKVIDLGLYISFSGTLTFKKADELRSIAASVPVNRILIETDCPYLAPVPKRGKFPNEPAWVVHTAEVLADVRGISVEEAGRITTENACSVYNVDLT